MRKFTFVFACALLACHFVFAQQNFRDGYIVTLAHDSIPTKVDDRSRAKNYALCRTRESGVIKEYTAAELVGYGFVNDKYFESGIVEGSFVEVLVRGELSLYRYGNSFYVKKAGELYHLEEHDVKVGEGASAGIRKDVRWKGLVAFLIGDCMPGQQVLKELDLEERRLTELVMKYNACKESRFIVYKATKAWTKVQIGVVAGITRSTLVVNNLLTSRDDLYHSIDPSIGLALTISSPRMSGRLAFQPEVHLMRARYSSMQVAQQTLSTVYDDTYINATTISTPLLIRYSFPEKKYTLKLDAGANLDFHIQSDTRLIRERVAYGVVTTSEGYPFLIRKRHIGYVAGVAVTRRFSKFDGGLRLRYTATNGFSDSPSSPVQLKQLSLSVTLQLK